MFARFSKMPVEEIKPRRKSIRLKEYDYSQPGAYFVTICTQNRLCLFGDVVNAEMVLNDPGRMVWQWWEELNNKFPNMETDAGMVMPNHFHGILMFHEPVGATLRGRPGGRKETDDRVDSDEGHPHRGAPTIDAPTLGDVAGWFKTMTTNEYIRSVKEHGWPRFSGKLWQRDYYEHIVRDDDELNRSREYIIYNPANWDADEDNPDNWQ